MTHGDTPGSHTTPEGADRTPQVPAASGAPAAPGTAENRNAWEQSYAGTDQLWSGLPNDSLVAAVDGLTPGRALDLGCGEGGDVIWLASRGWQADGADISPTALSRARRAAQEHGVAGRTAWLERDLALWQPPARYDLVSASFLHTPADFPRTQVLRRAADAVLPGGRLLIIGHAAAPPWMGAEHAHHREFLRPEEERDRLALDPDHWQAEMCTVRSRTVHRPDGPGELQDSVLLLHRRD